MALDIARGAAVTLMVMQHLALDLYWILGVRMYYDLIDIWFVIGRTAAITFFIVFGISAVLAKQKYQERFTRISLRRGLLLLLLGGLFFLITAQLNQINTIYFGVLSFLGVSALLLPLVVNRRESLLVLMVASFMVGNWLYNIQSDSLLLFPLGTYTLDVSTADWYPLLPWFGFIVLGVFVGHHLPQLPWLTRFRSNNTILTALEDIGKHALLIYVLHQPLIWGALLLYSRIRYG